MEHSKKYLAQAKYHAKLDDIKIRVAKGNRERYKQYAAKRGLSLNALIVKLLEEDMKKHGASEEE